MENNKSPDQKIDTLNCKIEILTNKIDELQTNIKKNNIYSTIFSGWNVLCVCWLGSWIAYYKYASKAVEIC